MSIVFKWPKGPKEVIVTGTFDDWSKQLFLIKQNDGGFELEVPLPNTKDKIEFKFIVDGEWRVSEDYWTIVDESGNINNYVEVNGNTIKSKGIDDRGVIGKTIIPESGLSIQNDNEGTKVPLGGIEPTSAEEKIANSAAENEDEKKEKLKAKEEEEEEEEEEEKKGAVEVRNEDAKDVPREKERKYVKRVVKSGGGKTDVDNKQINNVNRNNESSINNSDNKKDKKKSFFSRLLKK